VEAAAVGRGLPADSSHAGCPRIQSAPRAAQKSMVAEPITVRAAPSVAIGVESLNAPE
jgi:hypothetical protein